MTIGAWGIDCGCECTPPPTYCTPEYSDTMTSLSTWTVDAGSFSVGSTNIECTTSDSKMHLTALTSRSYNQFALDFMGAASGDEVIIYLRDDYYIKITVGSSGKIGFHKPDGTECGYVELDISIGDRHTFRYERRVGGNLGYLDPWFLLCRLDDVKVANPLFMGDGNTFQKWCSIRNQGIPVGTGSISSKVTFYNYAARSNPTASPSSSACVPIRHGWFLTDEVTSWSGQDIVSPSQLQCVITSNTGELDGTYIMTPQAWDGAESSSNYVRYFVSATKPVATRPTVSGFIFQMVGVTPISDSLGNFSIIITRVLASNLSIGDEDWEAATPDYGDGTSISIPITYGPVTGTAVISYTPV